MAVASPHCPPCLATNCGIKPGSIANQNKAKQGGQCVADTLLKVEKSLQICYVFAGPWIEIKRQASAMPSDIVRLQTESGAQRSGAYQRRRAPLPLMHRPSYYRLKEFCPLPARN